MTRVVAVDQASQSGILNTCGPQNYEESCPHLVGFETGDRFTGEGSMKVSVFIATSLDGFIARADGAIDWLPNGGEMGAEDYGYGEFFDSVDAIAMGRHTYELVLSFNEWPYGDKPVIVLSNHSVPIPMAHANTIEVCAASPQYVCQQLAAHGLKHLYVDGGITIQSFLQAGLLDHLTISRVPVLIGHGIPLFGPLAQDVRLRLTATRSFANGVAQSRYDVVKSSLRQG